MKYFAGAASLFSGVTIGLGVLASYSAPAFAQSTAQQQAQAYYFQAEAALADGNLEIAEARIAKAIELLGSNNAKLSALQVKILVAQKRYLEARTKLDEFYRYKPGPNLRRDMAAITISVDDAIAAQRSANAEMAAELAKYKIATDAFDANWQAAAERPAALQITWSGKAGSPSDDDRGKGIVPLEGGQFVVVYYTLGDDPARFGRCHGIGFASNYSEKWRKSFGKDENCPEVTSAPGNRIAIAGNSIFHGGGALVNKWQETATKDYEVDENGSIKNKTSDQFSTGAADRNIVESVTSLPSGQRAYVGYRQPKSQPYNRTNFFVGLSDGEEVNLWWSKSNIDFFSSIHSLPNGDAIIAGARLVSDKWNPTATRVGFQGGTLKTIWSKVYEHGRTTDNTEVTSLYNGNIVFAGSQKAPEGSPSAYSVYFTQVAPLTGEMKVQIIGNKSIEVGQLIPHPTGGMIAIGSLTSGGQYKPWIAHLSDDLQFLWQTTLDEVGQGILYQGHLTADGNLMFAGNTKASSSAKPQAWYGKISLPK